MASHCSRCGFDNPPGMRFCGNCGTRLVESDLAQAPAAVSSGELDPQQLGVTMGADLLERFRQAGLEAAGQRRNVTVLFTDLSGYTELAGKLDSEDVYNLIKQYVHLLIDEVYKYEGIVDKLTGDGLMALFGAPIAHENNAERAVRAALDMQARITQWSQEVKERMGVDLHMRVGLHAGTVIVGGIGSNMLMDYTAIGDTVNLARRIEEAASAGTILVSQSVFQQTRMLFDYTRIPNLSLKGVAQPVTAYRVKALKSQPGSVRGLEGLRAPMIGRDRELEQLREAAAALTHRKEGRFVLITGEAGIGKSRLTSELKAQISRNGVCLLQGQSLTYRRSVSYWIFLDLLRSYLGVTLDTPEAEVSKQLVQKTYQALGHRAPEILPYLEHLLSLKPSNTFAAERLRYLDAVQLRQQIFLAMRDLLVAEARRFPLLLILEDLHWADDASLDLLLFLLDSIRLIPMLILGISRPFQAGGLAKILQWTKKNMADHLVDIRLRSLSPVQSENLLFNLLTTAELPSELREQILQRAAGVPFYLEEILRTLIDGGVIQRQDGSWRTVLGVDASTLGVPDTLQGLILARFDRLDEFPRRVLQIASVIGHNFGLPLLKSMLRSADEMQIRETLALLLEREFISPLSDGPNASYAFRHVLMSEAIYNTLLKSERSKLHGLVGEAIETLYANRLNEQIELLARHYSWSPRLDRALHYLILAGQKAAASYVNEQARQNFEQALGLLPQVDHTPDQVLQIHMGLGDVLILIGEYQVAREHYLEALKAISVGNFSLHARERSILLRKVSTAFERQGDYDQALEYLAEARLALQQTPSAAQVENAQILNELGWINFRRGSLEAAEEYLVKALSLVENTSRYDVTASIYNRLGGVYYQKDQLDLASSYVRKSLVLREEIGDIVAVARSYNNLGLLGWKGGDWDNALESFTRSVELHATLGDVEGMVNLHGNLGLLYLDRGNIPEANKHLQEALSTAQQIGNAYHTGVIYLHFSRLYVATEDWQTALDYSNRSIEIFNEIGAQDQLVDLYTNTGQAWLGLGNLTKAQELGEKALALFEQLGGGKSPVQAQDRARALRLLGDVARLGGDIDLAEQLLKESASIFASAGNQLEQGRSNVSLAILDAVRGDTTRARLLLNEVRLIFRQLGANLDLRQLEAVFANFVSA